MKMSKRVRSVLVICVISTVICFFKFMSDNVQAWERMSSVTVLAENAYDISRSYVLGTPTIDKNTDHSNDVTSNKNTYNGNDVIRNNGKAIGFDPYKACKAKKIELVICVTVARSVASMRQAIRETWGRRGSDATAATASGGDDGGFHGNDKKINNNYTISDIKNDIINNNNNDKSNSNVTRITTTTTTTINNIIINSNSSTNSNSNSNSSSSSYSNVLLLFFVGIGNQTTEKEHEKIDKQLELESKMYGDIVQGDFIDSYRNLSLKSTFALRWVAEYCPGAEYMLKTDADMYVNVGTLLGKLKAAGEKLGKTTPFIFGNILWNQIPKRSHKKWAVSKSTYPNSTYPPHALGGAYAISRGAYPGLVNATRKLIPPFSMEDIYITGMCREKAGGFKLVHEPLPRRNHAFRDVCMMKTSSYSLGFTPNQLREMHNKMSEIQCS